MRKCWLSRGISKKQFLKWLRYDKIQQIKRNMGNNQLTKAFLIVALLVIFSIGITSANTASQNQNFSIIVLPDTQHYSESYPWIFTNQTQWIIDNMDELNIKFVIHEGDIVEDANDDTQWNRANKSMSVLDGKVPYGILPGNHDENITEYEEYFPAERYGNYSYWGGSCDHNTNNYQLFSGLGMDFIVINLGWKPDSDDIIWANEILKSYSERKAIVVTHGYMDKRATREIPQFDSSYIWNDLIVPNRNVFLVLCGHTHSEARRMDVIDERTVHQLLADYQDRPNGGDGWLRIIEFRENKTKASNLDLVIKTYSPFLNKYETDEDSQFELREELQCPSLLDISLSKIEIRLERLKINFMSILKGVLFIKVIKNA